jgi:hypothetical protein
MHMQGVEDASFVSIDKIKKVKKKNVKAQTKEGGPGVWPVGGSIPSFLIFCFFLYQDERRSPLEHL